MQGNSDWIFLKAHWHCHMRLAVQGLSEEAVCDVWSLNQDEINHIAGQHFKCSIC
jgi:hypothetical protein